MIDLEENMVSKVKEIQNSCLDGLLSVSEAISQIDAEIGGITKVVYKPGKKFKIHNHDAIYDLTYKGISRRSEHLVQGLAVAAYNCAQSNGSRFPGEVHIEGASTKHYKAGFDMLSAKYS